MLFQFVITSLRVVVTHSPVGLRVCVILLARFKLQNASIDWSLVISEITNIVVMVYGNSGSIWVRGIGSIFRRLESGKCFCWEVETNMAKRTTSTRPPATGKTGKAGGMVRDRTHDEAMAELFADAPAFASDYLNEILKEGNQGDLLVALRQLTGAKGGIARIAMESGLNQTQLYRTLSQAGNPELRSLVAILKVMGFRLAVLPV